jgi:hypothetical protein
MAPSAKTAVRKRAISSLGFTWVQARGGEFGAVLARLPPRGHAKPTRPSRERGARARGDHFRRYIGADVFENSNAML